ncbi:viral or transposable element protein [Lithospermum erythrorhizon]|uniref:Viral or transposable element protein n=1 Tax=Lithospermum erythrorhizon TaxID=34254 RepID=A0AAV3QJM0_LITER
MEKKTPKSWPTKRPLEDCADIGKPRKREFPLLKMEDVDLVGMEKRFKFRVLLPNGKSVEVTFSRPQTRISMEELVNVLKQEYLRVSKQSGFQTPKRGVNWKSSELHVVDVSDKKFEQSFDLRKFEPDKWNFLRLQDGSEESQFFENMWDLTPDTDLLKELPSEHSFETALADLIDNALQAVWSNSPGERKLISVEISNEIITIADSGPGLDESLDKWGKMGASLHRSVWKQAIGGKAPFLTPFFGMFGYGGPIASMKLGECALISSKKKGSRKVFSLLLDRKALLTHSSMDCRWKADGGLRDPSEEELVNFPNGSFMKIEISEPKVRVPDVHQLQRKLKDIYFPYIQCDLEGNSGRTVRHIEFQVNGTNLAEVEAGEVAITNFHSCNGASFTFKINISHDTCSGSQGLESHEEANARLKFVYFPIVQGKESIESILEKLEEDGHGLAENYENFSRVSVRRLGRLLPDARWLWLPFMDFRQRKGDKAQVLKRCCSRVKCFIETDAGFIPTTSKTDLAHHHPYTIALKNFGNKSIDNHKDENVLIFKDDKQISLQHLDKKYQEWILQMHDQYDEEINCGEDEPTYVVGLQNKKKLGISSDVLRIHRVVRRKGFTWQSGQKIKILKGACAGFHKTTVFATLEYIILEGLQGDAGGEARLLCRPIGLPDEKGCFLTLENGAATLEIGESLSAPLSVIDSGKCLAIGEDEWNSKFEMCHQKFPSSIELLNAELCQQLEIEKALPVNTVCAGYKPPEEIVAVIRPGSFDPENSSKSLNQKYIVKESHEMVLEINFDAKHYESKELIYSAQVNPLTLKGFQGCYIFPLKEVPNLFERAGAYTFSLSLNGHVDCGLCEKRVLVKPLPEVGSWRILRSKQTVKYIVMVGSCFLPLKIGCYDKYNNRIPFGSVPEVKIHFNSIKGVHIHACNKEVSLSPDKLTMLIKDLRVESSDLDKIRPKYEATLLIYPRDEAFSVPIPCQVLPGPLGSVVVQHTDFRMQLLPGHTMNELILEVFDKYGNHLKKNEEVQLDVDGFHILDKEGFNRKVDDDGYVDLSGILKIIKGYGEIATLSVLHGDELVFWQEFQIEKRELRTGFEVPKTCVAGSLLENLVFEVTTSEGEVDESCHDKDENGNSHTLTLKSDTLDIDDSVQYVFRHGRCTVRAISLPCEAGVFSFIAYHSRYPQLQLKREIILEQPENLCQENMTTQYSEGLICQAFPAQMISERSHQDFVDHEKQIEELALVHVTSSNQEMTKLISAIQNEQKELEDEMYTYGTYVGDQEKVLKKLKIDQLLLNEKLNGLQASIDHNIENDHDNAAQKMMIMKKISQKCNNAAAVVCKLLKSPPSENQHREFVDNMLGVVALLGSVQSKELSMILSRYIGEDHMLAVVCKTYSAASAFEKYELGQSSRCSAFNELATELGCSVSEGSVICLEDVRSYPGQIGRDPQGKLALLDPALPDGSGPPGYLGYAVNMIHLDADNLQWRNAIDHGLRETIFYGLLGELQVYQNKDCMNKARSCVKVDAVSLDGAIMRRGVLVSFGEWEPDIHFPVLPDIRLHYSQEIEQLDMELHKLSKEVEENEEKLEHIKRKFWKIHDKYNKFLDEKAPFLASLDESCSRSLLSHNVAASSSS